MMNKVHSTHILVLVAALSTCCFWRATARQFAQHSHYHAGAPLAFSLRRNTASKRNVQQKETPLLDDLAVQQSTQQSTGKTSLEFHASTKYATDPLLVSDSSSSTELPNKLSSFLFDDSHRDMVLAGVDSQNEVQLLQHPDIELYRLWQVETARTPTLATPSVGDAILRVTTTGIRFPGLNLKTVATVGCKKVQDDDSTASLQITLIRDELQAEGPPPLVWVFQQLTGTGKQQDKSGVFPPTPFSLLRGNTDNQVKGNGQERRTHSTNVVTAECCTPTTDNRDSIVFSSVAQLSICVSFPSMLLRLLPVSKEMAESQGSEAINRVVSRDIGPSLEALKKQFEVECVHVDKGH